MDRSAAQLTSRGSLQQPLHTTPSRTTLPCTAAISRKSGEGEEALAGLFQASATAQHLSRHMRRTCGRRTGSVIDIHPLRSFDRNLTILGYVPFEKLASRRANHDRHWRRT